MLMQKKLNFEKRVISIREDYIRDGGDEDMWLFNPNWKISPSIAFVKGKGPVVNINEHSMLLAT
jgi:hypothetical protein